MEESLDLSLSDFIYIDSSPNEISQEKKRVKNYSIDSLVHEIKKIKVIKEKVIRHKSHDRIEIKEEKVYTRSSDLDQFYSFSSIPIVEFERVFNAIHPDVTSLLIEREYLVEKGRYYEITRNFHTTMPEDFSIGLSTEINDQIFDMLDNFLWEEILLENSNHPVLRSLFSYEGRLKIEGDLISDYIFRFGNTVYFVDFVEEPTDELLELIQIKISLINQEQMQNYFQIISTYSTDISIWLRKEKKYPFFEIIGNFLSYTWRPFDMEECRIYINGARGSYGFAKGGIQYQFSWEGFSQWNLLDSEQELTVNNPDREFQSKSIQLTINKETIEPITMDLYLKSRSNGNVDPRQNILLHNFIKQTSELIGKLIDLIIPIQQMERSEEILKWRTFFDRLRIQTLNHGENLDLILRDSIRVIRWFYDITEVKVFMENLELVKMLQIYQTWNKDRNRKPNYSFSKSPLKKKELFKGGYLPIILESEKNSRIIFYLKLHIKDRDSRTFYLQDTVLGNLLKEEMEGSLKDEDFDFLLKELFEDCISYNPTITLSNIIQKWPEKISRSTSLIMSMTQRILSSYSIFFDLAETIHGNLESGISRMRASRDRLTGLYNRQSFSSLLERFFQKEEPSFGLMFIDMDSFKIYNDVISHHFGDKLLIRLSDLLHAAAKLLPYSSIASRFGGDEFCFAVDDIEESDFEHATEKVFKMITQSPIDLNFYLELRREGQGFDINMISFLHRLIRPDVGGRREIITEFVEKTDESPRGHILNIFRYYDKEIDDQNLLDNLESNLESYETSEDTRNQIIGFLQNIVEEKITNNYIMTKVDKEFSSVIRLFIQCQLDDYSTDDIREEIIRTIGKKSLKRATSLRISSGLSHSSEYRLRSVSSLFKAADNRAYIAKHNGKNKLYGMKNQQIYPHTE